MTGTVTIRPGAMRLADWRAIARGAPFRIDPAAHGAVDAACRVIERIVEGGEVVYGVNTGFGRLASQRIAAADLSRLQVNLILSHSVGVGEPLPAAVVRLVMALKLASLGRGASGVRWRAVKTLERMAEADILPVIPAQGSVGASGDLAPLAHMTAAMLGHGDVTVDGERRAAAEAMAEAGIPLYELGPKEGLAFINGTQVSTALALFALFRIERIFQAALVAGALSVDAALGSDRPFDRRIQELRGQPGQKEVAATLRILIQDSEIRSSHLDCGKVQDPYSLRCQPQVMGAILDLMRNAACTLEIEANGVSDNPLVMTDTGEVISGGNFHAEPVAFAADMLALAAAEIGSISERRIAMLTDGSISGLPPFLTREPGLNSGYMIAHVTAAALASENKQRAAPASVDSLPTSANQEDHVSMATHAARRLIDMAGNTAAIIGIEFLAAARGVHFHAPLKTSPRLSRAYSLVEGDPAITEEDHFLAPDLDRAKRFVLDGRLAEAVGPDALPALG